MQIAVGSSVHPRGNLSRVNTNFSPLCASLSTGVSRGKLKCTATYGMSWGCLGPTLKKAAAKRVAAQAEFGFEFFANALDVRVLQTQFRVYSESLKVLIL